MTQNNNDLPWKFGAKVAYFPIFYEGALVGFGRREYVAKIVQVMNDEEKLRKALELACAELLKQSGGDKRKLDELIQKYLLMADRPKYGSRAIAVMLRDRQAELNVGDQEFARFCDSYRLSPQELQEIYAGEEVINSQLVSLARILGATVEELVEVRDGPAKRQ
ncbi:hypothetical protein [Microcoleus sp. FACHB-68]|uniref:hypothetical protein n=1 Tax=Microcoleus sp. FACHB-68 TaxID=2692826 RepID=UPI0016883AA2|nr:hypothetical protein [Microcoleus sp. FACHB-68]MBD1936164.1 hypothetical protein [Microcoleus sp. FACHB-68]